MFLRKFTGLFVFSLFIGGIISCGNQKLSKKEIIDLYGAEGINYFYETVFHTDRGGGVTSKCYRWDKDILISLHGEMLKGDSSSVQMVIKTINDLELGISLKLVDSSSSNLPIYFGNADYLAKQLNRDSVVTVGVGTAWYESGYWNRAKVAILNDGIIDKQTDSVSRARLRAFTILEEVVQTLGVPGDSYTYYGSLFFEGPSKGSEDFKGMTELDEQVVKLLYDKRIFETSPINRKDFEERFSSVLYNRIDTSKLKELAGEYDLDENDLDSLEEMIFRSETKNTFIKFPRSSFLKLSGDSTKEHLDFSRELASKLHTPYFQINLVDQDLLWNHNPSITVNFEKDEKYRSTVVSRSVVSLKELMFPYHVLGNIYLGFSDPENENIPHDQAVLAQHRALAQSLFKVLGMNVPRDALMTANPDKIEINETYLDYFRFLYDPRFPSGITKQEYDGLLTSMN